MQDMRGAFESAAPTQREDANSIFTFDDEMHARMVRDALKMSATHNPDMLIAGAAQDMLDGYNKAMDTPPVEG